MVNESIEDIKQVLAKSKKSAELPQSTEKYINTVLQDEEHINPNPSPVSEEIQDIRRESDISCMTSEMWQMLACNEQNHFQISPPNFDAYNQENPHWLDKPRISWETINRSKQMCEKWLNQHYKHK